MTAHIPLPSLFRLLGVDQSSPEQGVPMSYEQLCEMVADIRKRYGVSVESTEDKS